MLRVGNAQSKASTINNFSVWLL